MAKILMKTPLVEMDGDEMTRILWTNIKEVLLKPFIELKTEYYDLGLPHRDATNDQVTIDAAQAILRLGVGVKCATITANAQRVEEYQLKKMWASPNATIRALLDGTVFRAPIMVKGIAPAIAAWKTPITIARHAYGDVYGARELRVPGAGKARLVIDYADGSTETVSVHDFSGAGVLSAMHNTDASITSFARSCFEFALNQKQDLWFSSKDTIAKIYDGNFRDIFQNMYDSDYQSAFEKAGISYFYTLIDDAVARVVRSSGGFIWACKNYDGDVMSDMLATAFGSLAMMTSVLVSPNGAYEYEAAHGTVTRHYYQHLAGKPTSTNPVATIFAFTGALKKRGEMDDTAALSDFAANLEATVIDTLESGIMTGDLASGFAGDARRVSSDEFLHTVAEKLVT